MSPVSGATRCDMRSMSHQKGDNGYKISTKQITI